MPICPRCGKSLSTDQALTYHLNRKYKCGHWSCEKCNVKFDTKFDLTIHKMKCDSCSKNDFKIENIPCIFYKLNANNEIVSVINQFLTNFDTETLLGKNINSFHNKNYQRITKNDIVIDIPFN